MVCREMRDWLGAGDSRSCHVQYTVYAVLSVCCTSVYAVLGVCCTRCMLYLVYAVLGVNS